MNLPAIESKARTYAGARQRVATLMRALDEDMAAVKRRHVGAILRQVRLAASHEAELRVLVEQNPELFKRPKTLVIEGVRVGFEKGRGGVHIANVDKTLELIDKRLPHLVDDLVKTTREPIKAALLRLSVDELKRIGCTVKGTDEQVVVRLVDTEVDKLVAAMMKALGDEAKLLADDVPQD